LIHDYLKESDIGGILNSPAFIITRAPFRVSFAGGGTDFSSYYERDFGAVCSTAIDKYVYVMINSNRPILHQGIDDPGRHRIRLSYSTTEYVQHPDELSHPIVRESLKFLGIDTPMDIATMADVPAGTGLGSSGTFTVALLHALHLVKGEHPDPPQLAEEAAHVEMNLLFRPVGKQDHYAAAFGGLNSFRFDPDGSVEVSAVASADLATNKLFPFLMLVYTGQSRDSGTVLSEQRDNIEVRLEHLNNIRSHAVEISGLLNDRFSIQKFGDVLHGTWMQKKELATNITNSDIDYWYDIAIKSGALGGKICGAGGGGFLLLVVEPKYRSQVKEALQSLDELPIGYEPLGSRALL